MKSNAGIKMDLKKPNWQTWAGFIWLRTGESEHCNELFASIKCR